MRRSLTSLYGEYQLDAATHHLRARTRFVPGEGCEYFPLVAFVGEAPGAAEERAGRPFVGASGQLLRKAAMAGGALDESNCFITNLVKYRPPGNRAPTLAEAENGVWYVSREMAILTPEIVVPLGSHAAKALLGAQAANITEMHGTLVQNGTRSYFPVFHPSYALRNGMSVAQYARTFRELRRILG
jgi:uracil-DNA glycosylase family 4